MPKIDLSPELFHRLSLLAQHEKTTIESWLEHHLNEFPFPNDKHFFELTSDVIVLVTPSGYLQDVNTSFCTTFGYTREECLNRIFTDIIHPDDIENTIKLFEDLVGGQLLENVKIRCICKDGTYKWISWNAVPPKRGLIYALGHDITSRRQTEESLETATNKLQQNQDRLQEILNTQIDLVCRYLPDTTLTYVNDAYCDFAGTSREELIGVKFLYMLSEDQHPAVQERLNAVLQNPQADIRIFQANNIKIGSSRWIQWVDYGITNDEGQVVEIQAVGRDITDFVNAQLALHEQSLLLQTIFDSIPLMITLIDQQGRFAMVNKQWVESLEWTVDEMNAHPDIMSMFYPDPVYRQQALEYMSQAKPGWREFVTVAKNGREIPSDWTNVRLPNGSMLGIGRDLTLEKQLESQQQYSRQLESDLQDERDLSELKERFISTVSHEFRTPLAIIMSSTEFVQRYGDQMSPERVDQKFETIISQIHHMVSLLDEILILSRTNRGKVDVVHESFNVASFMGATIEKMKLVDPAKNHHFVLEIPNDDYRIVADVRLLEHMLTNLLSNAIKYSPNLSTIKVKVSQLNSEWLIEVIDEGVGIPPDDLPRIFNAFHRARNAGDFPGTGLGLTIVQQYAELQGGRISVESELNKGTRFIIELPIQ